MNGNSFLRWLIVGAGIAAGILLVSFVARAV